jgi:uncharacterized protein (DUF885 family)
MGSYCWQRVAQRATNLIPVHQFWGTPDYGAICRRKQRTTFQNRKDYNNFLKRMDLYSVWIDSAMVYMKKGITKNAVLPLSLTKMIPQFDEMATPNIEDNLFYSAIKMMPDTTEQKLKKRLTTKYTA